jgi:hypothetical protein
VFDGISFVFNYLPFQQRKLTVYATLLLMLFLLYHPTFCSFPESLLMVQGENRANIIAGKGFATFAASFV